jgi:hypothetical protein
VDEAEFGPLAFQAVHRSLAAVAAAVVDDPEDPLGADVGLGRHYLFDQPAKGLDAGLLLAPPKTLARCTS